MMAVSVFLRKAAAEKKATAAVRHREPPGFWTFFAAVSLIQSYVLARHVGYWVDVSGRAPRRAARSPGDRWAGIARVFSGGPVLEHLEPGPFFHCAVARA